MKRLLAAVTFLAMAVLGTSAPAHAAPGVCNAEQIVSSVPFFAKDMVREGYGLTYRHRDDARITVTFSVGTAEALAGVTRTQYAEILQERGRAAVTAAKAAGGFAVPSVFPFDPVAYRVITAEGLHPGQLLGNLIIHVSDKCVLSAVFSSPNAASFRSRWTSLVAALDAVRDASARFGSPIHFVPESNAPNGPEAYILGLVMPAVLGLFIALFLGRLHGATPPGAVGRTVLTLSAVAASAALGSNAAGIVGILLPKEIALLLAATGILTMIGASTPWNVVSLAGAGLAAASAIALGAYAAAGWAGEPILSLAVSFILLVNGLAAAFAWGRDTLRHEHKVA